MYVGIICVLAKCAPCPITCNILYLAGSAFYIRWGNSGCPVRETKLYSGHIFESSNTRAYANGDYLCLPDDSDVSTPQTTETSTLYLNDVTDSDHKTVPCVACLVSGRSTVFTYPGHTNCPTGWTAEYVGYEAANPMSPGPTLCLDTSHGDWLSREDPCFNLAVIAKGAGQKNVVSCVVCSI